MQCCIWSKLVVSGICFRMNFRHMRLCFIFSRAVKSGKWEQAIDCLVKKVRIDAGRKPTPTYGLIDSQSTKTTLTSEERGFDARTITQEEIDTFGLGD